MNKKEYLDLLAKELDSMSYKDVRDILEDEPIPGTGIPL